MDIQIGMIPGVPGIGLNPIGLTANATTVEIA